MEDKMEVIIEKFCDHPEKYKIICCDGGVLTRQGCVELHGGQAVVFEGKDGYERAKAFIEACEGIVLLK